MTNLPITNRIRSAPAHVIYGILAVLSFVVHLVIYQLTSFSVILVRPEFYYSRFVIRDSQGQSVGEVSLTAGCGSFVTALAVVMFLFLALGRFVLARSRQK